MRASAGAEVDAATDAGVWIARLELRNVAGFRSLDLDLHPHFNVLCGVNGAGKTTVLRALRMTAWGLGIGGAPPVPIRKQPIDRPGEVTYGKVLPASIKATIRIGATTQEVGCRAEHAEDWSGYAHQMANLAAADQFGSRTSIVRYFGVDRLGASEGGVADSDQTEQIVARALTSNDFLDRHQPWWRASATISGLTGWRAAQHLIEQQAGRRPHLVEFADEVIAHVWPGAASISFDFLAKQLVVGFADGDRKQAEMLSDGEKNLLAMVGGIVMAIAGRRGDVPLDELRSTTGVVLIDELDLSLHPGWQQRIAPALRGAFPQLQFIVTSHSPTLVSTVDAECVRILDRHDDGDAEVTVPVFTNGAEAQVVLERLFGVDARWQESTLAQLLHRYEHMLIDRSWDSEEGRRVFDQIVSISQNSEPAIGRLLAARQFAAFQPSA